MRRRSRARDVGRRFVVAEIGIATDLRMLGRVGPGEGVEPVPGYALIRFPSAALRRLLSIPCVTRLRRPGRRRDFRQGCRWCSGGCGDDGLAVPVQRGGPEGKGGRRPDSDKAQARRDGCGRSREGDGKRCGETAPRRGQRSGGRRASEREQFDRRQEGRRDDLLGAGASRRAPCAFNPVIRLAAGSREHAKARIELAAADGALWHQVRISRGPDGGDRREHVGSSVAAVRRVPLPWLAWLAGVRSCQPCSV